MRIAINLAAVKSVGTTVYCSGFMPALARLALDDQFVVFMSPELSELIGSQLPENFEQRITSVTHNVWVRILWEQTALPCYLRRWRADVLFAPMEFTPLLPPCPMVLAIHNPSPHLDNGLQNRFRRWLSSLSCRAADRVIFVSKYSAEFLGSRLGVPLSKRVVIYHGTDHSRWARCVNPEPVLSKYAVKDVPYILFVSQLYRYKRPETLIEAFAIWLQRSGRNSYRLLLTGTAVDPDFFSVLNVLVEKLGIDEHIQFLGYVPASDISILYQNATAFVLPTSIETFGHPFVEAMSSGVPVICADIAVAHEICGDAALYFPVGDADVLAQTLESLVSNPDMRTQMIRRGHVRATQFTWDREARETLALLHGLSANNSTNFSDRER